MIYPSNSSFDAVLFISSVDIQLNSFNTVAFFTVFNLALFFRCIVKYLLAEYDLLYSPLPPMFFMLSEYRSGRRHHPRSRLDQRDGNE